MKFMNFKIISLALLINTGLVNASSLNKLTNFQTIYEVSNLSLSEKRTDTLVLNVSDFIDSVYGLSSVEKYRKSLEYINIKQLSFKTFINFYESLIVAGLRSVHQNPLLGTYFSTLKKPLKKSEFFIMLDKFTKASYRAKTKAHNWPFQISRHYLNQGRLNTEDVLNVSRKLKRLGVNYRFIDKDFLLDFVHLRGSSLSPNEIQQILNSLSAEYDSVQIAGRLFNQYIRLNVKRLTQQQFRSEVAELKKQVPYDLQIDRVMNMPIDARKNLFYAEYEFFKGFWEKDLFFNIDRVVELFQNNVPSKDHRRLVKSFIERNGHRLKDEHRDLLSSVFLQ